MRIAVLADTHTDKIERLPKKVIDTLSEVDLIIHAGDFTDIRVLTDLRRFKEVKAVHGNMDSGQLKSVLPTKEIVETNDKRIGIIHGSGAPWGIEERVRRLFESDRIGIITIDGEAKGEIISSR